MHYQNGRQVKAGDEFVQLKNGEIFVFGIIHKVVSWEEDYYRGCLHIKDVVLTTESGLPKLVGVGVF